MNERKCRDSVVVLEKDFARREEQQHKKRDAPQKTRCRLESAFASHLGVADVTCGDGESERIVTGRSVLVTQAQQTSDKDMVGGGIWQTLRVPGSHTLSRIVSREGFGQSAMV